eukprot:3481587-Prymnesium_polylepis.1
MARWFAYVRGLRPAEAVSAFRSLTFPTAMHFSASERFAIFWTYSFCGAGNVAKSHDNPIGLDLMIGILACMLKRETVVFAANPNDNGLIHQELVDYEFSVDHLGLATSQSPQQCRDAVQYRPPPPPSPPPPPPSPLPPSSPPHSGHRRRRCADGRLRIACKHSVSRDSAPRV